MCSQWDWKKKIKFSTSQKHNFTPPNWGLQLDNVQSYITFSKCDILCDKQHCSPFIPTQIWPRSCPKQSRFQKVSGANKVQYGLEAMSKNFSSVCHQGRAGAQLRFVLALQSWYDSCWQLRVVTYTEYVLQLSGNNTAPTKSQCSVIWVIQVGRCQNKLK